MKESLEENQPREVEWGLVMKSCGRYAEQFDFPVEKRRKSLFDLET